MNTSPIEYRKDWFGWMATLVTVKKNNKEKPLLCGVGWGSEHICYANG